jgi:RNA polymerase sigma-70 factor, ECF subfamily
MGLRMGSAEGDERELVRALRAGDEAAFERLVELHNASMVRVAGLYVRDRAVAQEVVQETWLAVLEGIDRFEERSSLKTWIFRTRGEREGRTVPFSAIPSREDETAVDADRFLPPGHEVAPRNWAAPPRGWPQERVLARETLGVLKSAISMLPDAQRAVITLRDVEGWSAEEVADALEITDVNQRVLLHRARSKVRGALEEYLDPEVASA